MDLAAFKSAFPQWEHLTQDTFDFWNTLATSLVCLPPKSRKLIPQLEYLLLAHVLTVNDIQPTAPEPANDDPVCDDKFLRSILNSGAKISSATIEGFSASFDNVGVNTLLGRIGDSPFSAWLAQTPYGATVAALLPRLYAGPTMAHSGAQGLSHYGDDVVLGHTRPHGGHL